MIEEKGDALPTGFYQLAGYFFCVPSMALILLVQVRSGYLPPSVANYRSISVIKVADSRLGWYRKSGTNVVNFIISKDLLENRIKDGVGLLNPLSYYLVKVGI